MNKEEILKNKKIKMKNTNLERVIIIGSDMK